MEKEGVREAASESTAPLGKAGRNTMPCHIACLDGTNFTVNIEKNAPGKNLIDKICQHLKLDEKEYFGLLFTDKNGKRWLDSQKPLKKQLHGVAAQFEFAVKFFEPHPDQLKNDFTRYLMVLQIREEIATGSLPCSFSAQALLGSYVIQSEFGDYDPMQHGQDYLDSLVFAPEQSIELIEKIKDLHRTHKGLTPCEADKQYLDYARKLTLYGVDLHEARDSEGGDIHVGVSFAGVSIYKDHMRINRFPWQKIDEVKYKGRNFFVKIKPGEYQAFVSTVVFKTPNDRATKELYKSVVEHHTFYRLREPDSPKGGTLPRLHSKFRYSDRTLYQLRQGAYNSLPRGTLTRRWSDREQRKRSPQDSEGPEAKIRKDDVPLTASEPLVTAMEDDGRNVYSSAPPPVVGTTGQQPAMTEKEQPMDVVFTFGACGPNADDVFEKEKDMVSGFLETITVSDTYYGVIEYGETKANIMARLGDFRNKERLNQYINTIPRSGEGRAIDKALEKAKQLLLDSGRPDARKALVIFANGKSSSRLAELTNEAKPLHDAGVKIIAVGIGDDIDDEELNSIATNKDKVILAQPYDEAVPLGYMLANEVSEAPSKELVDVTFVMGASGVDADKAFEKQKEVILSFVDSLKTNDARLAIVNYDSGSDIRAQLNDYKDKEDFKKCVDKQKRTGDGKALDQALVDTRNVIKNSGRPGVRKAVVVFANGKTGAEIENLAREAQSLHGDEAKVVSVCIGDDVNEDELKIVANSGVILAEIDQESEIIAQCILEQIGVVSGSGQDALDIAFAFGSSGPEANIAFNKEKEMINLFIDSLKVHDAQYGLIEYSSEARVLATFGQYTDKEKLKKHVNNIERKGEGVGLDKALSVAYDLLIKKGRRRAKKVLIVFISGKANVGVYELRACAKALQDSGVKIVAVGIGSNVDQNQLKEISSDEKVLHSQMAADPGPLVQQLSDDVVSVELTGEPLDIMFALGSAGEDAELVFEREKEMVYAFVNSIDTGNVHYGLIEYAENATLQANFNEYKEKYDFKEFVDSVKRIGEGVDLDKVLIRATEVFHNGSRDNAKRVFVIFTNAQSKARTQDLQKHSKELQDIGVKVVVVAIGTNVNHEQLNEISSHGAPVLEATPHGDVDQLVKGVATGVLSSVETPTTPVCPKLKIDVVFAIGAAGRDANDVFEKEKEIVNSFIDNLKDNDTQYSIIEFGHKANVKYPLGSPKNIAELQRNVREITRSGDGKCLDKVLEQAVQIFQNEARGESNRVLIVLTNAKSNARTQDLKKHAQALHDVGVKVQVVAVGNDINEEELVQVSSNEVPVLRVQAYEEPQAVLANTTWIVGEKPDEFLDIVFAFGSFGDKGDEVFEKEKELINSFIDSIQKRDTKFGIIEIGPRAKSCAMIGQYTDHVRLKRHVNLIQRSGDATGLNHALELTVKMFENQSRVNSKRVLILFTNGRSGSQAEELQRQAEKLNAINVDVILVAIGDEVDDDELQYVTMGSHPIINIAPEQNPRAVVYSIVGQLEDAKTTEPLDIVFVIGATGEQADVVYNKNKEIMAKYIEANKTPHTMYSVVGYGQKAVVHSKFGEHKDRASLQHHIATMQHNGDGAKTLDKALEQSTQLLETQGRFGARKRLVVFANGTSGSNINHLKKCTTHCENADVKVVTVAVGDEINDDDLRHICPVQECIVKVAPQEDTEHVVLEMAEKIEEPVKPKFDIVFAFGASGQTADVVFEKEKDMISSFIDSFQYGDYRYGVVEYGTKATTKAKFDEIYSQEKLKAFIRNITRSGEGKALDKALEHSHELFKKHGRQSARKVLIVFANGKSNARIQDLKKHAANLADLNTKLIVVAVGDDVNVQELNEIVPSEAAIVKTQPEQDNQQLFSDVVRDSIEERPVTDVDVIFAIGASGKDAEMMFTREKEFINGFIDASTHGQMNYAVLEYGSNVKEHFSFTPLTDREEVKEQIKAIQRSEDGTTLIGALRRSGELFTNDGRAHAHKVLIVLMNGLIGGRAGELRSGAKLLHNNGVKIVSVAIGNEVDHEELRQLSSDDDNIIHAKADEDIGSIAYVMTHQAVKGTPVHDEVVKREILTRTVYLQPKIRFVIRGEPVIKTTTAEEKRLEEEKQRLEEEENKKKAELEQIELAIKLEQQRVEEEEQRRKEEEEKRAKEAEKKAKEAEKKAKEAEKKAKEVEKKRKEEEKRAKELEERLREEEEERQEIEKEKMRKKKESEIEDELVMMPFAVATPEIETVKVAHRKTLEIHETPAAEKASFLRVETKPVTTTTTVKTTPDSIATTIVTRQQTSTVYSSPSNLQDDVLSNRDATPEIRYSLKTDLNLDHEQGERGFVRDQIKNQEKEIKRRSIHEQPTEFVAVQKPITTTTTTMVESPPPPGNDDVFRPTPTTLANTSSEIPNVETRTVIYKPSSPTVISNYDFQKGDPVVVTRRVKIDSSPVTQTTKTTHVLRQTSTPAEVVTKTITIEGDGEPLTASELAEIMNMSGSGESPSTVSGQYQKVEKVQKVEQVVTSKQFVQSGQSFIVETGDPDADAAIMKALEDARKQDPNVKVAEVTITKQESDKED